MSEHERQRADTQEERTQDAEDATPRSTSRQDSAGQERPQRPAEEAGQAPHQVDDPPQAEGDRRS